MPRFYTKIFTDSGLSFIATFLVLGFQQFLVMPYLGSKYSGSEFGSIIYFLGIVNIINGSLASPLSNVRVRNYLAHKEQINTSSDYNVLHLSSLIVGVTIFQIIFFWNRADTSFAFTSIYLVLLMVRTYSTVFFRIDRDYVGYFKVSLSIFTAYLASFFLIQWFEGFKYWLAIYIMGETMAVAYIFHKYNGHNAGVRYKNISKHFRKILSEYSGFIMLGFLDLVFIYFDRLLIKPLLGPEELSTFYILSFFAKLQPLIISILAGVLLSYLATMDIDTIRKNIVKTTIFLGALAAISFLFVHTIGPFVISSLYPHMTISNEYKSLLIIINASYAIISLDKLFRSINVRFTRISSLLIRDLCLIILCTVGGIFLVVNYSLLGFCILLLGSALLKFSTTSFLVFYTLHKR